MVNYTFKIYFEERNISHIIAVLLIFIMTTYISHKTRVGWCQERSRSSATSSSIRSVGSNLRSGRKLYTQLLSGEVPNKVGSLW